MSTTKPPSDGEEQVSNPISLGESAYKVGRGKDGTIWLLFSVPPEEGKPKKWSALGFNPVTAMMLAYQLIGEILNETSERASPLEDGPFDLRGMPVVGDPKGH